MIFSLIYMWVVLEFFLIREMIVKWVEILLVNKKVDVFFIVFL